MSKRSVRFGVLAAAGLALIVGGCAGIPDGTSRRVTSGQEQVVATGAGIVKLDGEKTVIKIRCGLCRYESEEMVVATPKPGKPTVVNWVCPRCGHKQKIVVSIP